PSNSERCSTRATWTTQPKRLWLESVLRGSAPCLGGKIGPTGNSSAWRLALPSDRGRRTPVSLARCPTWVARLPNDHPPIQVKAWDMWVSALTHLTHPGIITRCADRRADPPEAPVELRTQDGSCSACRNWDDPKWN